MVYHHPHLQKSKASEDPIHTHEFSECDLEILNQALLLEVVEETSTDPEHSYTNSDYCMFQHEEWFTIDERGHCDF